MNWVASAGLEVKATTREAASAMHTAIGRIDMKSPTIPGQKKSGTNAPIVVSVELRTAAPTSREPTIAASAGLLPSWKCR